MLLLPRAGFAAKLFASSLVRGVRGVLRSMTGFGAAKLDDEMVQIAVEARSVNGRFLKVSLKTPPSLAHREGELEGLVREQLRRGSVTVSVHFRRKRVEPAAVIDEDAARAYVEVFRRLGLPLEAVPTMPGVLTGGRDDELGDDEWGMVEGLVRQALKQLTLMREREGRALAGVLGKACARIDELAAELVARAPAVVAEHQARLRERVRALLADQPISLDDQHLAREVAIFADRSDVTEELDRLGAHVAQVRMLLARGGENAGRTLDFLSQELLREANTIGSKSSDVRMTKAVIELKAEIERFKEQSANVE